MALSGMRLFSVLEITRYIHELFDSDGNLADVRVRGEISNLTKARSGHWYFTLKDSKAQMRCVMFRGAAQKVRLDVNVGDEIVVHGRVSVYEARGEYQLYADAIEALGGVGDLHRQYERLKAKLAAEGLFDAERKRELPSFPRRIGIATSPTAAAFQDILNALSRRFPHAEIILSPTKVQGSDAPSEIVAALEKLGRRDDIDVIIVARGGGSLEDLWAFNDEAVARAIAASACPVISGIGHEIDFTIADFAADLRAATPSAAAELATPNRDDLLLELDRLRSTAQGLLNALVRDNQRGLQGMRRGLRIAAPLRAMQSDRGRLGGYTERMNRAITMNFALLDEGLKAQRKLLEAANPNHILARGYALVSDESGAIVRSAGQTRPEQRLRVRFHQDEIMVKVEP